MPASQEAEEMSSGADDDLGYGDTPPRIAIGKR